MLDRNIHSTPSAIGPNESVISSWAKDAYKPGLAMAGTLAMGVMAIKSPSEISILSRETPQAVKVAAETLGEGVAQLFGRVSGGVARFEGITGIGEKASRGAGTAFAIAEGGRFNGKLLTAAHEVDGRVDKWVVDQAGSVHEIRVLDTDRHNDLTLLQLTDQSSLGAFNPLRLRKPERFLNPNELRAFGYPEFSTDLVMSTGYNQALPLDLKFFPDRVIIPMELRHGNSGGPLTNREAEVIAIASEGATNNGNSFFVGPPGHIADRLVSKFHSVGPPEAPASTTETGRWFVSDQSAAAESLARFWQKPLTARPEIGQLYPTWSHANMDGTLISTRASLNYGNRILSLRLSAINGKGIRDDFTYGQTKLAQARLDVHLDDQLKPASVVSSNDPEGLLPKLMKQKLPFVEKPSV